MASPFANTKWEICGEVGGFCVGIMGAFPKGDSVRDSGCETAWDTV